MQFMRCQTPRNNKLTLSSPSKMWLFFLQQLLIIATVPTTVVLSNQNLPRSESIPVYRTGQHHLQPNLRVRGNVIKKITQK